MQETEEEQICFISTSYQKQVIFFLKKARSLLCKKYDWENKSVN